MSHASFSNLSLTKTQLDNLNRLGYHDMTEIQEKSLPLMLNGQDVIAKAKTGSGKTAAFSLAIINHLDLSQNSLQALVLCPTRELSTQVTTELRRLGSHCDNLKVVILSGGIPIKSQIETLKHGTHIVVGTPGRIKDHLSRGTLSLNSVNRVVLDEADRMLDMGFFDDISFILNKTAKKRQMLFFSATYPPQIQQLSAEFQHRAITVEADAQHSNAQIKQLFYLCDKHTRINALCNVIYHKKIKSAVIFCNTKLTVNSVCQQLHDLKYSTIALHGDLEQFDRNQALVQFSQQSCSFLVATDVASRGLDIEDLPAVINFDLPNDPVVYLHRIGRTGRAGKKGMALSLFAENEQQKLIAISELQNRTVEKIELTHYKIEGTLNLIPPMRTLRIKAGRKNKISAGDLLGALTSDNGVTGKQVGNIKILSNLSYVAIEKSAAKTALKCLSKGLIKGRKYRVELL